MISYDQIKEHILLLFPLDRIILISLVRRSKSSDKVLISILVAQVKEKICPNFTWQMQKRKIVICESLFLCRTRHRKLAMFGGPHWFPGPSTHDQDGGVHTCSVHACLRCPKSFLAHRQTGFHHTICCFVYSSKYLGHRKLVTVCFQQPKIDSCNAVLTESVERSSNLWPFKWNLLSSTFLRCCLLSMFSSGNLRNVFSFLPWSS